MGRTQMCVCCHKYRQTLICFILFASTFLFTHILFMAEGREISKVQNQNHKENLLHHNVQKGSILVEKAQIGSRPPKCERRCTTSICEHCEAVQVPIVPQFQRHRSHYYATNVVTFSTRGEDLSNYKPISWKCRCGDYFFNP